MIDEEEIKKFKSYLPQYLQLYCNVSNLKKHFHCLNPNHPDRHPSMYYSPKYQICKCFSCGERYDIYDLIKLHYGLTSFREQHNKIAELFNELDKVVPTSTIKEDDYIEKDFSKYFYYCHKNIGNTDYLTNTRHIDKGLQDKYFIGYDTRRKIIIFPLNEHSYFGRSTTSNNKYKTSGIGYLFNEDLLKNSTDNSVIYVTESVIDSLSLETIIPDIKTISLNGYNTNRFLSLVKEYDYDGIFVLALDNDSAGLKIGNSLKNELDKLGITSFNNTLIKSIDDGKYKDINKALTENKEALTRNLTYFYEQYNLISKKLRGDNFEIG